MRSLTEFLNFRAGKLHQQAQAQVPDQKRFRPIRSLIIAAQKELSMAVMIVIVSTVTHKSMSVPFRVRYSAPG